MFGFGDPSRTERNDALEARRQELAMAREQANMSIAENTKDQVIMARQEEREDLIKWQQELSDELTSLKFKLRRMSINEKGEWVKQEIPTWNPETRTVTMQELPPYLNEVGISSVETIVSPLLSRNLINTNIDEDRILSILKQTSNDLVNNFAFYGEQQYGMEFGNFSTVLRIIKNTMIPTPFRAIDGWNKKIDNTISKRVESFNSGGYNVPEKKKFFGIF